MTKEYFKNLIDSYYELKSLLTDIANLYLSIRNPGYHAADINTWDGITFSFACRPPTSGIGSIHILPLSLLTSEDTIGEVKKLALQHIKDEEEQRKKDTCSECGRNKNVLFYNGWCV